jgi:hypothetical protein
MSNEASEGNQECLEVVLVDMDVDGKEGGHETFRTINPFDTLKPRQLGEQEEELRIEMIYDTWMDLEKMKPYRISTGMLTGIPFTI